MSKVQTIEKTGKKFKALILASYALIAVGVFGLFAVYAASDAGIEHDGCVPLFFLGMIAVGIITKFVVKILIWWNHG